MAFADGIASIFVPDRGETYVMASEGTCVFLYWRFCSVDLIFFRLRCLEKHLLLFRLAEPVFIVDDSGKYSGLTGVFAILKWFLCRFISGQNGKKYSWKIILFH